MAHHSHSLLILNEDCIVNIRPLNILSNSPLTDTCSSNVKITLM
jgi:hypothetical protein